MQISFHIDSCSSKYPPLTIYSSIIATVDMFISPSHSQRKSRQTHLTISCATPFPTYLYISFTYINLIQARCLPKPHYRTVGIFSIITRKMVNFTLLNYDNTETHRKSYSRTLVEAARENFKTDLVLTSRVFS